MQNQFSNVLWENRGSEKEVKQFRDTIRWINIGNLTSGFIGVDYNPQAKVSDGVARSTKDISFLAKTLLQYGYSPAKYLFVLKPPYIQERQEGLVWRKQGLIGLKDWANKR